LTGNSILFFKNGRLVNIMIKSTIKCHQRKGSNSIMHSLICFTQQLGINYQKKYFILALLTWSGSSFVPCKTNLTAFTTPLLLSPFCKYIKMTDVNKRERKPKKKTINNGQSGDTCNIGHTRQRRQIFHSVLKFQSTDENTSSFQIKQYNIKDGNWKAWGLGQYTSLTPSLSKTN
jgi:hypothetical protein